MKAVMSRNNADTGRGDASADGSAADDTSPSASMSMSGHGGDSHSACTDQEASTATATPAQNGREDTSAAAEASAAESRAQETKGQMQQRHKREAKANKDAVKKLGKKRKEEGEKLEADLAARHAAELAALEAATASAAAATDGSDMGSAAIASNSLYGSSTPAQEASQAQKRREKKEKKQAEREQKIAEELAGYGDSRRVVEEEALATQLLPYGLMLRDIPPDGNCLYRAVEDQLQEAVRAEAAAGGSDASTAGRSAKSAADVPMYEQLRQSAVDYMRSHEDEFAPFVLPEAEEGPEGEDASVQFQKYCDVMAGPAVWGGQAELSALAHVVRRTIQVFSVGMPPVTMGEEYAGNGPALRVSFQRHAYELGEHYNSLVPGTPPPRPKPTPKSPPKISMNMHVGI